MSKNESETIEPSPKEAYPLPEESRKKKGITIRNLEPRDRSRVEEMILSSGNFNKMETTVALELVEAALEEGEESGYVIVVVEEAKVVLGYACYGPTPMTEGTYDLYWIVVDRHTRGKGVGRRLIEFVERDVVHRRGRLLLIETSSQESYASTIRFYRRSGYELVARIKNFYRLGDDKLIFSKELK